MCCHKGAVTSTGALCCHQPLTSPSLGTETTRTKSHAATAYINETLVLEKETFIQSRVENAGFLPSLVGINGHMCSEVTW